jgi:hypothetical protein
MLQDGLSSIVPCTTYSTAHVHYEYQMEYATGTSHTSASLYSGHMSSRVTHSYSLMVGLLDLKP